MNPYIGDRQLEPDEDLENDLEDCIPDMTDQGEPNDYPED